MTFYDFYLFFLNQPTLSFNIDFGDGTMTYFKYFPNAIYERRIKYYEKGGNLTIKITEEITKFNCFIPITSKVINSLTTL